MWAGREARLAATHGAAWGCTPTAAAYPSPLTRSQPGNENCRPIPLRACRQSALRERFQWRTSERLHACTHAFCIAVPSNSAGNRLWEWFSVGRYGTKGFDYHAQQFEGEEWPEELGEWCCMGSWVIAAAWGAG